jgi:hypothetical protein
VRAELLFRLGRYSEACPEFKRAAELARNARERDLLLQRACECAYAASTDAATDNSTITGDRRPAPQTPRK